MSKTRSIITLGSFDGVHRGHQAILTKVVERARARGAMPTALVFGIPPRYTQSGGARMLLTTLEEKKVLLRRLGIRTVHTLVFDSKTAATSPETFFMDTIVRRHRALEMIVGPRVAFGKNKSGRLPVLRRLGARTGIKIDVISGVGSGAKAVSSSAIRLHIQAGDVEKAAQSLGYNYEVSGKVAHGDRRGRTLGYPTVNIAADPGKILPPGVFWVHVGPLGIDGLCNIGTRPTFNSDETAVHMEVFLLGKVPSLYGRRLRVQFIRRIRAEKHFASPAALIRQIEKDIVQVRTWQKTVSLQTVLHSI